MAQLSARSTSYDHSEIAVHDFSFTRDSGSAVPAPAPAPALMQINVVQ
jgi:hypothetical protein